jgi:hypothetical protein
MQALGLSAINLQELGERFTEDEVLKLIRSISPDKAPGPDGFIARFMQATWGIIHPDVMHTFDALWHLDMRDMHCVNDALLVLRPKTVEVRAVKDYRPILLIHSFGKLMSKVLGNRLAFRIGEMVHPLQSAFIAGRAIQDTFKMVQASARILHSRKRQSLFQKIDITHTFDTVAWPFVLDILHHLGFPNCTSGQHICHARGLRQGNPLSLLLFVLVMEVLDALFHKADDWGLFHPLDRRPLPHRAFLYADDHVLMLYPRQQDINLLRQILDIFQGASGLSCNLSKCQMVIIRCDDEQWQMAATLFPCQQVEFPITYLGMPLSTGKLPRSVWQ